MESEAFRIMMYVACGSWLQIHSETVIHRIVEMYASIKRCIIDRIRRDLGTFKFPIVHLLVDEWACKLLKRKFIGIRIRYVNEEFELVTMLLSVRFYDKSKVDEDISKASDVLLHWTRSVLHEYQIPENMIFAATTDAGTEVRFMASKLLNLRWEWCCSHLITNAIKEACGQLQSQKNKVRV